MPARDRRLFRPAADEVVTEALFLLWQRQQDQVGTDASTPPGSRQ
jgi:hypothetical protein